MFFSLAGLKLGRLSMGGQETALYKSWALMCDIGTIVCFVYHQRDLELLSNSMCFFLLSSFLLNVGSLCPLSSIEASINRNICRRDRKGSLLDLIRGWSYGVVFIRVLRPSNLRTIEKKGSSQTLTVSIHW